MKDNNIKKYIYYFMGLLFLLGSGLFIARMNWSYVMNVDLMLMLPLLFAIILVHTLKLTRLYIIYYDYINTTKCFFSLYCRVMLLSISIPFKLGEIYKVAAYGYNIKSYFKGFIIVLLDRFIDTLALMTMVIVSVLIFGGKISWTLVLLMIFLLCIIIVYLFYPYIYKFWNKRLLSSISNKRNLFMLDTLKNIDNVYREIDSIWKGKGIILYVISVIAWVFEMTGLVLFYKSKNISSIINNYLSSIIGNKYNDYIVYFTMISILFFCFAYLIMFIVDIFLRRIKSCK